MEYRKLGKDPAKLSKTDNEPKIPAEKPQKTR